MSLLDLYFKIFLNLFQNVKSKKKKTFKQLIINGERHEEVEKVEKSGVHMQQKRETM